MRIIVVGESSRVQLRSDVAASDGKHATPRRPQRSSQYRR
jgi:hypothetical protein